MTKPATSIELHVTQRQLRVDGAVVTLGARAFDVLLALASRRGHIVTKAELFAAAWPGLTVDDNTLQAQISALRKLLGANAIATVPQRGYQLIIAPDMRLVVEDARAQMAQPTAPEPLLAVLPFDNLSNDAEMQFFCDGVSDELLQRIARGASLKVVGRTSSFQFRGDRKSEAADALKCTHILDGSVRRAADRVRLSVHLIEAATQTTLWSSSFDRGLADMFSVQDEIAENIAGALNRKLSAAAIQAVEPAVYDLYLHGIRPALTPIEMQSRIDLLEAVTQRAPNFVCGWGKLAEQRAHLRLHRPYAERGAIAKVVASEAAQAQKIDERNPGARIAQYLLLPPWGRFIEAEAIIERLSRDASGPGWLVHKALHLRSVGRVRDALEAARSSFELDALNPFVANAMGLGLWYAGLNAEARARFEATLARWPDMPAPANNLIMLCADAGDWDAVDALLSPARLAKHPLRQFEQGARGYAAIRRAATPAALHGALAAARRQFESTGFTLNLLAILAHLGGRDEAYAMAAAATFAPAGNGDDVMGLDAYRTYFLFHASYPELRADPRFVRLCARLGLVQYWTATQRWPDCADEVPYDFREECARLTARRLTPERRSA